MRLCLDERSCSIELRHALKQKRILTSMNGNDEYRSRIAFAFGEDHCRATVRFGEADEAGDFKMGRKTHAAVLVEYSWARGYSA